MKWSFLFLCMGFLLNPAHLNAAEGSEKNLYQFTVKTIDGKEQPLSVYQGKVLLIVNTASQCGFTPQYKGLEAIYKQFKDQGFEVLAFPANNFLGQEPGSNEQIKKFCELKYKTTFPVFAKIDVKGKEIAPLYKYLTQDTAFKGPITWNFNKFLVNKKGQVVARFGSRAEPQSQELVAAIQEQLKG